MFERGGFLQLQFRRRYTQPRNSQQAVAADGVSDLRRTGSENAYPCLTQTAEQTPRGKSANSAT